MAHKKSEDSKLYSFDPEFKPSYKQLSKAFSEMHAYALSAFKKNSLQRKLILKLKKDINYLNSVVDSLNKEHNYLASEQFNVYDTYVKRS